MTTDHTAEARYVVVIRDARPADDVLAPPLWPIWVGAIYLAVCFLGIMLDLKRESRRGPPILKRNSNRHIV